MIFNIHAGHAAIGKGAVGAVSILNESKEDRIVKDEVIRQLRLLGHTVYDCTVDSGTASQVLAGIVKKCNEHKVDLDVSIHFNAGVGDVKGNGQTTGTECLIYSSSSSTAKGYATKIVEAISALGFKNRGVKVNPNLYVLKNTNAQAVLIECCFVDDADDAKLYDSQAMAEAIVKGLVGKVYKEPVIVINDAPVEDEPKNDDKIIVINDAPADDTEEKNDKIIVINDAPKEEEIKQVETPVGEPDVMYRVQVGAYKNKANAEALVQKLKDAGFNAFVTKA